MVDNARFVELAHVHPFLWPSGPGARSATQSADWHDRLGPATGKAVQDGRCSTFGGVSGLTGVPRTRRQRACR